MAKYKKGVVIKNMDRLLKKLRARAARIGDTRFQVTIGYSAVYAAVQHERLDYHHSVGQAKYLEQPYREIKPFIPQRIADSLKKGKGRRTVAQAVLKIGEEIYQKSQGLVPVDTGFLKSTGFVRLDNTFEPGVGPEPGEI